MERRGQTIRPRCTNCGKKAGGIMASSSWPHLDFGEAVCCRACGERLNAKRASAMVAAPQKEIMFGAIARHAKTWLFHWAMSILVTLAFAIAGNPMYGAWAAAGGYTLREGQQIINRGNPTPDQWIDHIGDLMGAYLVLLVTWLVTR